MPENVTVVPVFNFDKSRVFCAGTAMLCKTMEVQDAVADATSVYAVTVHVADAAGVAAASMRTAALLITRHRPRRRVIPLKYSNLMVILKRVIRTGLLWK